LEFDESKPEIVYLIVPYTADAEAAQALLDDFVAILKQMAASPDSPVGGLIDPANQAKLKTPTPLAKPEDFGLAHTAFEQQAINNPTRPAIQTKTGVLSYGEFNARAERFASHLLQLGVKPGDMVPLFMQKSEDTLIAIFGVLKAGAAFGEYCLSRSFSNVVKVVDSD
jgi:non-ribosomal peptide synthetase component F